MISCPKCSAPASSDSVHQEIPCTGCEAFSYVYAFPRLLTGLSTGREAEVMTTGEEASCFFHKENRADAPCDGCGRYLCAVCEIEIDGRCLCSGCFENGRGLAAENRLVKDRVLWDSIVLSLAVLPMVFCYFSIIAAPIALGLGIRHFKTPASLVRGQSRMVAGIIIASLIIIGWISLLVVTIVGILEA